MNNNVSIITIGDELLIGQTIDTNSAWLAQELNKKGFWLNNRTAVGDNKQDIIDALNQSQIKSDIVIITGGLGPTADDITKPLLCEYFNGTLVEDEKVKQHVIGLFEKRGRKIIDVNLRQALVPDCCQVLFNEMGTAPGMLFEKENKTFISLPGVPFEMKHIMQTSGFDFLVKKYNTPNIMHRTLVTAGEGESFIAERLKDFESNLNTNIKLAYLPQLSAVKLRLTGKDIDENILNKEFEKLKTIVTDICYAHEDISLEQAINKLFIENKTTLCTAESCTGGAIASTITSVPNSSTFFKGSIVSYTNEIKNTLLSINTETLNEYKAVSEIVCKQMAENSLKIFDTDFSISITGYLDSTNTDEKNKGKVFIGIASKKETTVKSMYLPYDRIRNKELAINIALNLLFRKVKETNP